MGNKLIAGIVGPRGSHPSIYSCVLRENFIKVLKPEEILCNIRKSEEHLQVLNDIETRRLQYKFGERRLGHIRIITELQSKYGFDENAQKVFELMIYNILIFIHGFQYVLCIHSHMG